MSSDLMIILRSTVAQQMLRKNVCGSGTQAWMLARRITAFRYALTGTMAECFITVAGKRNPCHIKIGLTPAERSDYKHQKAEVNRAAIIGRAAFTSLEQHEWLGLFL